MAKPSLETTLAVMQERLGQIQTELGAVKELIKGLDEKYLTKVEFEAKFWPVKTLTYGVTGLLLVAIIGAIIANALPKV